MHVDWIFGVSLILSILIVALNVHLYIKKEKDYETFVAAIVAFIGVITFTLSHAEDNKQQVAHEKEIIALKDTILKLNNDLKSNFYQNSKILEDTLIKTINSLRYERDSLERKLIQITGSNDRISINTKATVKIDTLIQISTLSKSGISFNKGDEVVISASGSISLGPKIGPSGPNGVETPFINLFLKQYDIVTNINHGALMVKFSNDDDWKYCGSYYKFIAQDNGYLIFNVNDNKQSDNSGLYEVSVAIYN